VVFLTSGEKGVTDREPSETADLREAEAAAAAKILGVQGIVFWRLPDGAVRVTHSTVGKLQALLSTWPPDLLYVPHPGEQHPDHRSAYRLATRALRTSRPTPAPILRLYKVWMPLGRMDAIVDITSHVATRLAAIRAYTSQCAIMRFDDAALALNRYRGEMHSWTGGDYAEVFMEEHQ
jgi:N-acetylglucosamine malate deacetylase 1